MMSNWIIIEYDTDVIDKDIDEAMEEMEADYEKPNMENDDDKIIAPPKEMTTVSYSTGTYALITFRITTLSKKWKMTFL